MKALIVLVQDGIRDEDAGTSLTRSGSEELLSMWKRKLCVCVYVCVCIYIYIYIYVCVCVCENVCEKESWRERQEDTLYTQRRKKMSEISAKSLHTQLIAKTLFARPRSSITSEYLTAAQGRRPCI